MGMDGRREDAWDEMGASSKGSEVPREPNAAPSSRSRRRSVLSLAASLSSSSTRPGLRHCSDTSVEGPVMT